MATHPPDRYSPTDPLIVDLLASLDALFGLHPGFRAAHAKGIMCSGTFTPASAAAHLTRAPHITRPSTPVIMRLSDFAGVPNIPDNHPEAASPRGIAVRFQLADHVHTDLVGHSADGFPVSDGEGFLGFARAIAASNGVTTHPTPIEAFVGSHPAALKFVQLPKPIPTSFARESFFCVSAFHFTNSNGETQFGRYRILPEAGNEYLTAEQAAAKSGDFLMDELTKRIAAGPVKFKIVIQLAEPGDVTSVATIQWPASRPTTDFGTITLTKKLNHDEPELKKMIFDPIPRVDGIEPAADPLFDVRAAIYLLSGRRRRAAGK